MEQDVNTNPWLQSLEPLQKMIDAELLEISDGDDGEPRLIMTADVYDAFFFSDFTELRDDIKWTDKILIYMIAIFRWIIRFFPSLEACTQKYVKSIFRRRHWFDEPKALAFLEKVRFFINWRRGYVAGLRNYGQDEFEPKKEEDMLRKLYISDEIWIPMYILTSDYKPIIVGRWKKDKFELRTAQLND